MQHSTGYTPSDGKINLVAEYLLIPRERPPRWSSVGPDSAVVPGKLPVVFSLLDETVELNDVRVLSVGVRSELVITGSSHKTTSSHVSAPSRRTDSMCRQCTQSNFFLELCYIRNS